jgi:hypothetical protein
MTSRDQPVVRLTRLFVRRLLDNDLISPHADRHESLAVLYGLVASLSVFVTFFVAAPYLSSFVQLPGPTAMSALPDRFLFIAASMTICAIAALIVWDALALEPRDAAILGPLPISPWTITRAKLAAALVFALAFSVAVNAVPSVLYPVFLTLNMRGTRLSGIFLLIASQAITVVVAGFVGFFAILALRGLLRMVLGPRGFSRISSAAQSVLVVGAVTALLVTPTIGAASVANWVSGATPAPWPALPVLWHLGVNETMAGAVVVDTPVVMPRRLTLPAWMRREDEAGRSAYRAIGAEVRTLALTAALIVPLVAVLALGTFLWSNRRLPEQSSGAPLLAWARAPVRAVAARLTRGNPEAQAGFFFTLQTLARSAPHRLILAVVVALAVTFPFITLVGGGTSGDAAVLSTPLAPYAIAIMVLLALTGGFRYAVSVPAELAANWSLRMAWQGDERDFLTGVKRAGILIAAVVPLLVLLPLQAALLGTVPAGVHSLFGLLFAVAVLDVSFFGYRKMPFACSYLPLGDPKLVWPIGTALFLLVPYGFAFIERAALRSSSGTAMFGAVLVALVLFIRIADRLNRRQRWPISFDEAPAQATQRLGLFERMAVHD